MLKVDKFSGEINEVSFHENHDLKTSVSNPKCANLIRAFVLFGVIDSATLQSALHLVVLRHEALRTKFAGDGCGSFVREVSTTADVVLIEVDFREFGPTDTAVVAYMSQIAVEGFDPAEYPLVKIRVLRTSENRTVLVLTAAQVIADAISASILIRELSGLYVELSGGLKADLLPVEYRLSDFVASQNIWMRSREYRDSLRRLRDKLHSLIEIEGGLEQLFFAPKQDDSFLFNEVFSDEFSGKVFQLAAAQKVSVPTVLTVVSAMSVARVRDRNGLFFTSSFSNRHLPGAANLVGYLATTVPNYLDLRSDEAPMFHVKSMHKEIFASMSQYGMIPIQEIGGEIMRLYPPLPDGTSIKFGKVVIDVAPVELPSMFGVKSERYLAGRYLPVSNEFKFVYGILPDNKIRLHLKGLLENGNELVASHMIEYSLQETLASLCA